LQTTHTAPGTGTPSASADEKKTRRLTYDLGEVVPPTLALAAKEKNVARVNEVSGSVSASSVSSLVPPPGGDNSDLNSTYKLKMPTRATKAAWLAAAHTATSSSSTTSHDTHGGDDDDDSDDVGYREDIL